MNGDGISDGISVGAVVPTLPSPPSSVEISLATSVTASSTSFWQLSISHCSGDLFTTTSVEDEYVVFVVLVVFVVFTTRALGIAERKTVGWMLGALLCGDEVTVLWSLLLNSMLGEKSVRRLPSETTTTVVQQLMTSVLFFSDSQVASSIKSTWVWVPWKVTVPDTTTVVSLGSNSSMGVQSLPSGMGACPN